MIEKLEWIETTCSKYPQNNSTIQAKLNEIIEKINELENKISKLNNRTSCLQKIGGVTL